jgi:hypothetical protein
MLLSAPESKALERASGDRQRILEAAYNLSHQYNLQDSFSKTDLSLLGRWTHLDCL